ncbi:hypothetical protein GALMADRAFT_268364 [Galerina marginata CBS 339.88]|uniref:Uncharacterized protein n=1 Tax=Galerina marginata (strain CBS 339.88) TaxID=685588 RepID=A0A067T9W7_GALM3|nr:hypothetical protein GALMADRAFT_268364 [Galerina marginata CBS 339.88]
MTPREAGVILASQTEDTVDISRIEASDSVQSHLSSTTSSKRLRLPPSNALDTSGKAINLDVLNVQPERFSQRTQITDLAQTLLFPDCPDALLPTTGRLTRVERSWAKFIAKCAFFLYCALSCLIASVQFYVSISEPWGMDRVRGPPEGSIPEINKSFAKYLTKSSAMSSAVFEPFVMKNENSYSNVTICAWLPGSKIHLLESWTRVSQASLSLVITTSAALDSAQHKRLLEEIRQRVPPPSVSRVSIHLLHVKETGVGSPNLYLNLARLLAFTDWTLIFPGELNEPFPPWLQDVISSIDLEAKTGAYLLIAGAYKYKYPFPALSPLLLRKDRDFWCTERFFAGVSRATDWDECLWQLYLEMTGEIYLLDVPSDVKILSVGDKASASEVCLSSDNRLRRHQPD